jgi:CRP/FNR family cyclic AMP-dependent transcriptional regulator
MQRALFILGILEDEDVDWLISVGQRWELDPGSVLIQEGQPSEFIFLVLDGLLEVSIEGSNPQSIAQLAAGEVVGEMSFVDGQLPSATVSAQQHSLVLAIDATLLRQQLGQDVWFAARFFKALSILLSSRLRSTVKHLQGEHWRPVALVGGGHDDMSAMLSVGKIRFDWMLKRLRNINSNPWEGLDPVDEA